MFPLCKVCCPICSFILQGALFRFAVSFARWGRSHWRGGEVPTARWGSSHCEVGKFPLRGGEVPTLQSLLSNLQFHFARCVVPNCSFFCKVGKFPLRGGEVPTARWGSSHCKVGMCPTYSSIGFSGPVTTAASGVTAVEFKPANASRARCSAALCCANASIRPCCLSYSDLISSM